MVLEEPIDTDDKLVPSFDNKSVESAGGQIDKNIVDTIQDFETTVVPKIINLEWMDKVAKSTSKPYYNDTEQNLNGHILPGIDILINIVQTSPMVGTSDLRDLISLWVVHDSHKLMNYNEDEFSILMSETEDIVESLNIQKFNGSLALSDYHSSVVALHNSDPSKIDDSTSRFTRLRPVLRLVDMITSISEPEQFTSSGETLVMKVFNTESKKYKPGYHRVDMKDSVIRSSVNLVFYEVLKEESHMPVDIREDAVLYVKPVNSELNWNVITDKVIDRTVQKIRESYGKFKNRALVCSDMESFNSQQMSSDEATTTYSISNLSKALLEKEEVVRRVVQASVVTQNRPNEVSEESKESIRSLNKTVSGEPIQINTFIEGMATLVDTLRREILPYLVDGNNNKPHEQTVEGALIHIFECDENVQERLVEAIKSDKVDDSYMNWPYKYIIARYIHKRFQNYERTERVSKISDLILRNINDISEWKSYCSTYHSRLRRELFIKIASKSEIDGSKLNEQAGVGILDVIDNHNRSGRCRVCNSPTSESSVSPTVLTASDFCLLDTSFITDSREGLTHINIKQESYNPICIPCQLSISIRLQQVNKYNRKNNDNLHISTYPMNSYSSASVARFNIILDIMKSRVFTDKKSIYGSDIGERYKKIVSDLLENKQNTDRFIDQSMSMGVGSRQDATTSLFEVPDDNSDIELKSAMCVVIAALSSGIKAYMSKKPQMSVYDPQSTEILRFGPELDDISNLLLNSSSSMMGISETIKIVDRVFNIGSEIGSINSAVRYYIDAEKSSTDLIGSKMYDKVVHMTKSVATTEEVVNSCISMDILSSDNSSDAREVIQQSSELSEYVSESVIDYQTSPEDLNSTIEELIKCTMSSKKSEAEISDWMKNSDGIGTIDNKDIIDMSHLLNKIHESEIGISVLCSLVALQTQFRILNGDNNG